jgi:hypothetical protein
MILKVHKQLHVKDRHYGMGQFIHVMRACICLILKAHKKTMAISIVYGYSHRLRSGIVLHYFDAGAVA